jgi:hypothetical protein
MRDQFSAPKSDIPIGPYDEKTGFFSVIRKSHHAIERIMVGDKIFGELWVVFRGSKDKQNKTWFFGIFQKRRAHTRFRTSPK